MKLLATLVFPLLPLFVSAQYWTQKNNFPIHSRGSSVSFVIDDVAYAGLGDTLFTDGGYQYALDFYRYNPDSDTWTPIAPFPGPGRERAVAFAADGKGYVGLGQTWPWPFELFKDFYAYDPATDTWTRIADFAGAARSEATAFSINGLGYVGFGYTTGSIKRDLYKYTPATNTWQNLGNVWPSERRGATAFVIGDKAYMAGGLDGTSNYRYDLQEYDPATNLWTEKIPWDGANLKFYWAQAFVLNDQAYICYGTEKYVTRYDPVTNHVTNLGDVLGQNTYRCMPIAFTVGNKGYLGTGYTGIPALAQDIWQCSFVSNVAVQPLSKIDAAISYTENSDEFQLKLDPARNGHCRVDVYDLQGTACISIDRATDGQRFSMAVFPAGQYFVRFSAGGASRTDKMVVVH